VAMPKASMDKDHLFQRRENDVWLTRKIIAVESKSKTETMNH
jgi:hypothetical protein